MRSPVLIEPAPTLLRKPLISQVLALFEGGVVSQLELAIAKSIVEKEIEGIEMGVLEDGTAYLSGRSLAEMCGTAASTIIYQASQWANGNREGKLARMLRETGIEGPSLFIPTESNHGGIAKTVHAYPDDVCTVFLEYYAFESDRPNETARRNFRRLARTSLRAMIYAYTGFDLVNNVPPQWRQLHDRLLLNNAPPGYFSVFKEISPILMAAVQKGLVLDDTTMPDGSVGILWAQHWEEEGLAASFGDRIKHPHIFPEYFRQAKGKQKEAWVYPLAALGVFRTWLQNQYLPTAFPNYLQNKVKQRVLAASARELILEAVEETGTAFPANQAALLQKRN